MPRTSDARQKLIETAARLFQTRGYTGTGLALILEESGAPKGSFYHHFPGGKDELAVAAMRWSSADVETLIREAFDGAATWEAGLKAFSRAVADWFEASGYAEGCPIASVLLETAPRDDALRREALAVFETWIAALEAHLRRLRAPRPRRKAEAAMMAFEGAWLLARATHTRRPFEVALAAAMAA